ncbi:hypothetical protein [Flagellimonas lutimaris]|uniref:hypothetical protein n=1 Tax=Flagellimonas lutimaris TaxID=475082 RepID=UPI0011C39419|nr:hypothetical protein [Allomuricauda lutimaris]
MLTQTGFSERNGTKLCDAFLSRRDKKEEQEDSVLAQRYRSYMPRMASVYRDWVGHGKVG